MTRYAHSAIIVGAGAALRPHVLALHSLGIDIAAVVTADPQRARRARDLAPEADIVPSVAAALRQDASFAVVCTPPSAHETVAMQIAASGRDIVMEKPLGIDIDSATRLVSSVAAQGVRLSVVFQHRYKPAALQARALLVGGTLGSVGNATIHVPWWRPQDYYDEPGRGTWSRDGGGVLITQAIHILDLYQWLVGPISNVAARVRCSPSHLMESEDSIAAILEHNTGSTATLFATTAATPAAGAVITLYTDRATVRMVESDLFVDGLPSHHGVREPNSISHPGASAWQWFTSFYEDTLSAWSDGRDPATSGPSALRTQIVVGSLYRAAATRRWVRVASPEQLLAGGGLPDDFD